MMGFAALYPSYKLHVPWPSLRGAKRRSNPYLLCGAMDCFASLAMTRHSRHTSAFPRRKTSEPLQESLALKTKGVGNAGCPLHPQPPVQQKSTGVEATGTPESPGIPARNGFNGFLRALPGDRALLSPSPRAVFCAKLDASVEASGPHDFAVRKPMLSSEARLRPPHLIPRP